MNKTFQCISCKKWFAFEPFSPLLWLNDGDIVCTECRQKQAEERSEVYHLAIWHCRHEEVRNE